MMGSFTPDLAIDLGSSTTRIYARGQGVVASAPSVVAVRRWARDRIEIVATGDDAVEMIGRAPEDISIVTPVVGGVVADFDCIEAMLTVMSQNLGLFSGLNRRRILVGVPLDLTAVERRAVIESATRAGAREVHLVPKLLATAVGMNLPIGNTRGDFIVDLGEGTSEMGVVCLSGVVTANSERVGASSLNDALIQFIREKCNILIGHSTAEQLKLRLGSAYPSDDMRSVEIRGRDLITGLPNAAIMNAEDTREALEGCVSHVMAKIRSVLERTPPELAGDIFQRGVVLAGGGSLLRQLDVKMREATGLMVVHCDDPPRAVIEGLGRIVESPKVLRKLFV